MHRQTASPFFLREVQHLCQTYTTLHSGGADEAGWGAHAAKAHPRTHATSRNHSHSQVLSAIAETLHMKTGGSKPSFSRHAITIAASSTPRPSSTTTNATATPTGARSAPPAHVLLRFQPLSSQRPGALGLEGLDAAAESATPSGSGSGSGGGRDGAIAFEDESADVSSHASDDDGDGDDEGDAVGVDPRDNLTFNLHLTDEEKAMRAETALPYAKTHEEKQQVLQGTGAIFYEPDDVDDFDDEDPDDDLDI